MVGQRTRRVAADDLLVTTSGEKQCTIKLETGQWAFLRRRLGIVLHWYLYLHCVKILLLLFCLESDLAKQSD